MGVMANSPDFQWHMTNLRSYMDVSTTQQKEAQWGSVTLTPFGQAGGTLLTYLEALPLQIVLFVQPF